MIRMKLDIRKHLLEQKLVELSNVMSAKKIGNVETNMRTMDMGASKIEQVVGSRNLRPMGNSEFGDPNTKLCAIPGRNQEASSSGNVWTSRNHSEKERIEWVRKICSFTKSVQIKIGLTLQILAIRGNVVGGI